ncbi:AfsA-related hotdog domain-containing protein [Micromonospora sp. NPDC049679]|uniref:AfsA-related hotdog domain-containing protein n=1 Tax=Micromonospora sp. NPDC049679 TaxID=3155920 RepID=UPI0033F7AC6D
MNDHSSTTALLDTEAPALLGSIHRLSDQDGAVAELRVDQRDPFFFDHPLDHVPGMLMVCGMVELARACVDTAPEGRVEAAMTFRSMCELDPAPVLSLDARDTRRRKVRGYQDATVVADGWFEFTAADDLPERECRVDASRWTKAPASLVHRARGENIMIGDPWQADGHVTAAVLQPPAGHALDGRRPETHPVEGLVEAGRQFATWLPHRFGRWPLDAHMLWIGVTVELPSGLPRSRPVALRWRVAPIAGNKAKLHLDLVPADGRGPVLGSLCYASKVLGPAEYARFRGNGGSAA